MRAANSRCKGEINPLCGRKGLTLAPLRGEENWATLAVLISPPRRAGLLTLVISFLLPSCRGVHSGHQLQKAMNT